MSTEVEETDCVVSGGGPAGMMLGLLLARAGVRVTVMEKHADFLRDFRGDTVHASTLRMLDELGLGRAFAQIPHRLIETLSVNLQGTTVQVDLRRIPGSHKHIALVPQWDFLELLASAAEQEPTFTLLRSTEVLAPIREGGRVTGVTYRDSAGNTRRLRAALTVACDGRGSTLRESLGLTPTSFGAPMDVWWFRLPRRDDDPQGLAGMLGTGHAAIAIDRGDYFQMAYLIRKGSDAALRAEGVESLRHRVAELVPFLADRVDQLSSFDDVKLLDVQLNRLHRWFTDGLLLIGDAAHAMSPVGGVGINLAVADAVAAATILAAPLREHRLTERHLAAVQARRWAPTILVQSAQRIAHLRVIAAVVGEGAVEAPAAVRLLSRVPALRTLFGAAVAIGPFPQRIPRFARR
ncbi:FAD-dependent oxidoreductase [Mycobacterium sp. 852013-51886_SCH5428379]|uniref:FAD-dependent oxidoreductase n=1 Tax=Mycobacterium sp. 852013-51886_SCH5428379 TaxID=1834111 RepID=UPI000AE90EB0|nr:FAD-dependent oxidoreductase [Mycobacterium sp. 852013-51886_SCH5428379]